MSKGLPCIGMEKRSELSVSTFSDAWNFAPAFSSPTSPVSFYLKQLPHSYSSALYPILWGPLLHKQSLPTRTLRAALCLLFHCCFNFFPLTFAASFQSLSFNASSSPFRLSALLRRNSVARMLVSALSCSQLQKCNPWQDLVWSWMVPWSRSLGGSV